MDDIQEDTLSRGVSATQVKNAAYHLHYFLAWVLFACFYNIIIYHIYFKSYSSIYNTWFCCFALLMLVFMLMTRQFARNKNLSTFNLDTWSQLVCMSVGAGLAIGVYIINQSMGIENKLISEVHLIVFTGLLLSISYLVAVVYLAQRLRYFLLIFVPSALPVVFSKVLFFNQISDVYNFIFNVWFSVILISAILTHKIHKRLNLLNNHNKFYLKQSRAHLEESALLQKQLKSEITKSHSIEDELQLNNQLLEQKVKERTYDINKIKDRLENHQANLDFAHETAGIHSWLWNIEKRTVELSGKKSHVKVIQYDSQKDQIDLMIHPEDQAHYNQMMRLHLRGQTERFEATYRVQKDQHWNWIKDIGKVIARDPITRKPLRMVGIHRDIEQEKSDQEKLKLAANVFNQVAQGVFVLDNNLCFLEVNPFFCSLIDIPAEHVVGKHIFDITVNTVFEVSEKHSSITQKILQSGNYDAEVQEEFVSGKSLILWLHINAVRDDKNRVMNYVGVVSDLTDRRNHEQRLAYLENYDLLTDLPNRVYFNLQMHQYMISKSKSLSHFAIIRLNVDRFRNFNEYLNNQCGDELLKQISKRLKSTCSDALLISYLNNDDFALIYNLNHPRASIQQKVDEIMHIFHQPFIILDQEHAISASLGIAIYPEHGRQIGSLNSHAEHALVEAKKLGGNTVYFYNNKADSLFENDIQLEHDLRHAVKNNQLEVYYQPKVDSENMTIYGFEALIRWLHPQHGLIIPDLFLPIAEETSLISEIGQFVIFETCKQIRAWKDLGFDDIRVSVNVVAQQIHRGQLIENIDAALSIYNLKANTLDLELTESSLLDKSEHVIELLNNLKKRGITISLDDFGTGYSSLAYLADYPIDNLKIDKAFISKIGQTKDNAIVNAIVAMGKTMGMCIVAEGVENIEQIEYLQQLGCDYFQGYYFSKPLNSKDCTEFLSQNRIIAHLS